MVLVHDVCEESIEMHSKVGGVKTSFMMYCLLEILNQHQTERT